MTKNCPYLVVRPSSWNGARKIAEALELWHFRGQEDARWPLSSSLERIVTLHKFTPSLSSVTERGLIYEFQRRAHHYLASQPGHEATVEWLALLQHYGCPTRLLDFTHSFYIAAFFAVETAKHDGAIWAVARARLHEAVRRKTGVETKGLSVYDTNRRHIELVQRFIADGRAEDLVVDVEPERMSERLSIQQGAFLVPCNIEATFVANLLSTFDIPKSVFNEAESSPVISDHVTASELKHACVIKLVLPRTSHSTIMHDLRDMNITAAALFPGLDGFARSLKIRFRDPSDEDWYRRLGERMSSESRDAGPREEK